MAQNFDRVEIADDNGGARVLNWEQFWALPLVDRIQELSKGHLKFFQKDRQVPPMDAVRR